MLNIGQVDSLRITVLVDDHAGFDTRFLAQHGISILLQARSGETEKRILMDVGQSSLPILHNMSILDINPASIDMVFLSHCHYDHTQGLVEMLRSIGKEGLPIVAHPTLFRPNVILKPYLKHIGVTEENSEDQIKQSGGSPVLIREPFELLPGVVSSGEVERTTDFEVSSLDAYNVENGKLQRDPILDDMSLIVNVRDKGLVIVTGCAHAGIVNIIRHSIGLTGAQQIEGIIGGLHMIDAGAERIEKTVQALTEIGPAWVLAGHCTGFPASISMSTALGDRFGLLHAGMTVSVGSATG
jgi:7,8-dihydropterin-6-yl-methyl-4-(beta-D-ribofuranosyl)aminobenzene 5'-phosphate synthase